MTWSVVDNPSGTRKHEKANIQYARKSLVRTSTGQCVSGSSTERTHFSRMMSTSCRKSSQVLYSNGSSYS